MSLGNGINIDAIGLGTEVEFSKHLRKSQGSNYYSFNIYLSFDVAFDNVLLCVCFYYDFGQIVV